MKKSNEAERRAAQVAHDIRSPISVLKCLVDMVKRDLIPREELFEIGSAAERSLNKLQVIVDDMLDHYKARLLNVQPIGLNGVIKDVLKEVASEASATGVSVNYEEKKGIIVKVDAAKLNRVLTNIVLNGIQASDRRGFVMIAADREGSDLIVRIADRGCGIGDDEMTRIFDASFTSGKPRGTGLGLSYCSEVIEAHGGTIDVKSELGDGTTLTIMIPGCVVR